MARDPIPVTRSSMPDFAEYVDEIRDLWDSRWLTNNGSKHRQLESELRAYLRTSNLVLFSNGHLALEAAIQAFGVRGEVITTPLTFASTTHAIVRSGLDPVFCDVDPADGTLDVEMLESLVTDRTAMILPVHVYGNVCDVEAIEAIARRHGLPVIYDAAHAFGTTYMGVGAANFGDASMFSFHATKVFNTIEGGAVSFRDHGLRRRLDLVKNFGITGPETVEAVGGNAKLNEFQAAMGLCNLRSIEADIARRQVLAEHYGHRLAGVEGVRILAPRLGVESNYSYLPVVFDGVAVARDDVFDHLKANAINARKYFYPLTTDYACYRDRFDSGATPVAATIAAGVLTLPLFADLTMDDVDLICDLVSQKAAAGARRLHGGPLRDLPSQGFFQGARHTANDLVPTPKACAL